MGKFEDVEYELDSFNLDDYSDDSINEKIIKEKSIKRIIKNDEVHYLKAKSLKQLCIKPKPNEQYRIITEKQFNAYAFILYILETEIIEKLSIAIYRINEPTVQSIIKLIDSKKIKVANFVISSFFNQTKRPEQWALLLKSYCEKSKVCRHRYTHNHAKVILIQTKENYYVFEGSGNMSDNARIEQYIFENNKQVYNFHLSWIEEIMKK